MKFFNAQENRIKCGKCNTEFDLNKNRDGCPLCGFGKASASLSDANVKTVPMEDVQTIRNEFLDIPPNLNLKQGKILPDDESNVWGSWLMFNDFFAPKFLTRVLAWEMHRKKSESVQLNALMENALGLIAQYNLSQLKGFPNLGKDRKGGRLVYHFLRTFAKMGLVHAESDGMKGEEIWKQDWSKIKVALTKQGLEFAQINNAVFDKGKKVQILTPEEKNWMADHLKQIDRQGYREYSVLKEVYNFLKEGNNGNNDLINWFEHNKKFLDYIKERSQRAKKNPEILAKQIHNYARTFASAKVSLLREMGVVKDKRNDYTIIGNL